MNSLASPALALTDVRFAYGANRPAVNGVSLDVHVGEIVGLVGPNGSGKSTLIKLAFDVLELKLGEIRIFGTEHRADPAKRSSIYLPSDDYLPEFLTGREYVELVARLYGERRPSGIEIESEFEVFGMAGRSRDLIEDYSHGMRKKIQLIVAFLLNRPLTVVDETLNGIDLDATKVCKSKLLALRASEGAVLLCTHDFSLLEDVADRVAVLGRGRLLADVAIADLQQQGSRLSAVVDQLVFGSN